MARFSAQPDNQLHYDNIEFRWFRVPALHLLAVWLHQATGPHDLFIPVGTRWMPAVLHQGQVYPAEEFGALLRAPAQNRLETTKGKRA